MKHSFLANSKYNKCNILTFQVDYHIIKNYSRNTKRPGQGPGVNVIKDIYETYTLGMFLPAKISDISFFSLCMIFFFSPVNSSFLAVPKR